MDDKVEDIIIKATFTVSGLNIKKIDVYYKNKLWDKSMDFWKMNYR